MYDISYADMPRHLADDKAIDDLRFYVGDKTFTMFRDEADKAADISGWLTINNTFGFIGVRGYPVHAFGRRYCLTAYREWMADGSDPIATDAQGFKL